VPDLLAVILLAVPGAILAALFTPLSRRAALSFELTAPVREGDLSTEPRPYGGGAAILAAMAIPVVAAWFLFLPSEDGSLAGWVPWRLASDLWNHGLILRKLSLGAALFFGFGLMDDRYAINASRKLIIQVMLALFVVSGLDLCATTHLPWAYADEVLSIVWIVAVVNAYNMLDHADGLAAAVGAVVLVFLAAGQILVGGWCVAALALAAAGSLAGFLVFNFPPAKILMGDAGSGPVGFLLAVLPLVATYPTPAKGWPSAVLLVPVALLAAPLIDGLCVTLGLVIGRKSPLGSDPARHFAHRLRARRWSPRGTVAAASALAALGGTGSLLLYGSSPGMLVAGGAVVAVAVAAWIALRRAPRHT
jgi:UDP-GlcNAc:undecaprenyl-phosphate GlcNAc-1-phosphate transferase